MGILIQQVVGFTGNKKETYKRRRSRVRVPSAPQTDFTYLGNVFNLWELEQSGLARYRALW